MNCSYNAPCCTGPLSMLKHAIAAVALVALAAPAFGASPVELRIKNHKFTPATIKVKAGAPALIKFINDDDTAEEFDSPALKVEKVVAGHSSGTIRLRPLSPGRYPFMGEFHAATAQGVVIAE